MYALLLLLTTAYACNFPQDLNLVYGGIQMYDCNVNENWKGLLVKTNVTLGQVYQKVSTYSRGSSQTRTYGIMGQYYKFISGYDEKDIWLSQSTVTKYRRGKDRNYYLEYYCQSPICQLNVNVKEGNSAFKASIGIVLFLNLLVFLF